MMTKLQVAVLVPLAMLLGCSAATVATDDKAKDTLVVAVGEAAEGPLQMMSTSEFQTEMKSRLGQVVLLDMWATW